MEHRIITPNDTLFINRDLNLQTNSLRQAVLWNTSWHKVEVYFKGKFIGFLTYFGIVKSIDSVADRKVYAEAVYVKDEECFYLNTPEDDELDTLSVSPVSQ